jgi:hypothetical protein
MRKAFAGRGFLRNKSEPLAAALRPMPPASATETRPKRCLVEGPLSVEPSGSTAFPRTAGIGAMPSLLRDSRTTGAAPNETFAGRSRAVRPRHFQPLVLQAVEQVRWNPFRSLVDARPDDLANHDGGGWWQKC